MNKKENILNAALTLFVEYGFHGAPTSRIAKEAGVSNGTLFHYFSTKEDLIIELYHSIKEKLSEYLNSKISESSSVEVKMKSLFIDTLIWAMNNKNEFYYIQQIHFSPHIAKIPYEHIHKQTQLHYNLLQSGIDAKILKPIKPDLLFSILSSHVFGLHQYQINSKLNEIESLSLFNESF